MNQDEPNDNDGPQVPEWLPYLDPAYAPYVVMAAFALGCFFGALMGELGAQDHVKALEAQLDGHPVLALPPGYNFSLAVGARNDTHTPSLPLEGCADVPGTVCTG